MFEVIVLILLEILFVILFIFQDNDAILKMNFIWKHSFSKIIMQKCYKGEFSLSLTRSLMIMHS